MTDANRAPARNELPLLLVIIDDSEESTVALSYACARAKATNSRVALLRVIEPDSFMHWASLREMAEQEAIEEAIDPVLHPAQAPTLEQQQRGTQFQPFWRVWRRRSRSLNERTNE